MNTPNCIEDFIRQNRDAFDSAPAPEYVWERIARQLDRWPALGIEERFIAAHLPLFDAVLPEEQRSWKRIAAALDAPQDGELETFIRKHRDAFDTHHPEPHVWYHIAQALPPAPPIRLHWMRSLRLAAAAVALLIAGIGIGLWYGAARSGSAAEMALGDLSPEYAELENYLQREIQVRQERLSQLSTYRQASVLEDLRQMDLAMTELQAELAQVPPANREAVVRAMIDNYRARIAILERVLQYLQQQHSSPDHNSRKYDTEEI